MPCKDEYERIRTVDVGRPGHSKILVGVTGKKGPRGGTTEKIGGLRKYKRQPIDFEMGRGDTMRDGRGWPGEPLRHSDAALRGLRSKVRKIDKRFKTGRHKFGEVEYGEEEYLTDPKTGEILLTKGQFARARRRMERRK